MKKNQLLLSFAILIGLFTSYLFWKKNSIPFGVKKNFEAIDNRKDSLKWDYKMLKEDLKYIDENANYPLEYGAFPTPKYGLLGKDSFKGLGSYRNKININGKNILTIGFYFNNNAIYRNKLNKLDSSVFFTMIIFLGENEDTNHSMISSRNQPSYVAQGSCITSSFKVDYLAFITPEIDSYAIINMRLFDLSYGGNTIIITPQKDKTIRSLQLKSKKNITKDDLESHFNNLMDKPIVKDFLNSPNNIY